MIKLYEAVFHEFPKRLTVVSHYIQCLKNFLRYFYDSSNLVDNPQDSVEYHVDGNKQIIL